MQYILAKIVYDVFSQQYLYLFKSLNLKYPFTLFHNPCYDLYKVIIVH